MQQIFVNAEPDLELSLYYIFVINGHSGCFERSTLLHEILATL